MSSANPIRPELLLEHEPFVRAIARSLLGDEQRASDVVQDTWLAALRRPPRSPAVLRAWLGRVARNAAVSATRSDRRRAEREEEAARPERVESVAAIEERLAVQRAVVDAVLALREPYRKPILLRYYEGLSTSEIARRLGKKEGTVRSQLTRALEILREELDRKHGGDRSLWGAALLPLVTRSREVSIGSGSAVSKALVALLGVAAIVPLAYVGVRWLVRSEPAGVTMLEPSGPVDPSRSALAALDPANAREPATESSPPASGAEASQSVASSSSQREDLASLPTQDLLRLAMQTERRLRDILLTPAPELASEQAVLLAMPDTGLARILVPDRYERLVPVRGGGAYYSFATRENDYDAEPDIGLNESRSFTIHRSPIGLVSELGAIDLLSISDSPSVPPPGLSSDQLAAWELAWTDTQVVDADTFANRASSGRLHQTGLVRVGATYLARRASSREHDHLVAFRVLASDEDGYTFAWRILKSWPVEKAPGKKFREYPDAPVPEAPEWLSELPRDELVALLRQIREIGAERLLSVPDSVVELQAGANIELGFARLLERDRYNALIESRGGGAFYSFATRSHSYDAEPDLSLGRRYYASGFAGSENGWILDLGAVPLADLGTTPPTSDPREMESWDLMWNAEATRDDGGGERNVELEAERRARELRIDRSARAELGHTYLLRAILPGEHDHLIAFQTVAMDDDGVTIAWRILKSWPRPVIEDE